jgi:hypothetical protein
MLNVADSAAKRMPVSRDADAIARTWKVELFPAC